MHVPYRHMSRAKKTNTEKSSIPDSAAAITALESEDATQITQAMQTLLREPLSKEQERALCELVANWEWSESTAELWAAVVLGHQHSLAAIEPLLDVLTGDEDYLVEAAAEALIHIAKVHGEAVLPPIAEFWLEYIGNDSDVYYPYAAEVLVQLAHAGSTFAAHLLVYALLLDESQRFSLAADVADLKDVRYLPLLHRLILVADAYHDKMAGNELRFAYGQLSGQFPAEDRTPLWEKPWETRWQPLLDRLGKSEAEIDAMVRKQFEQVEQRLKHEPPAAASDPARVTLPAFDFAAYLAVRPRQDMEEDFSRTLRLLGCSEQWTVETVQERIGTAVTLDEVVQFMVGALPDFPSDESFAEFVGQLANLWNITPKQELGWLTPLEKQTEAGQKAWNDKIAQRMAEARATLEEEEDRK